MTHEDWLCKALPELFRLASGGLPVAGLGVLRHEPGRSVFSYIDGVNPRH